MRQINLAVLDPALATGWIRLEGRYLRVPARVRDRRIRLDLGAARPFTPPGPVPDSPLRAYEELRTAAHTADRRPDAGLACRHPLLACWRGGDRHAFLVTGPPPGAPLGSYLHPAALNTAESGLDLIPTEPADSPLVARLLQPDQAILHAIAAYQDADRPDQARPPRRTRRPRATALAS